MLFRRPCVLSSPSFLVPVLSVLSFMSELLAERLLSSWHFFFLISTLIADCH